MTLRHTLNLITLLGLLHPIGYAQNQQPLTAPERNLALQLEEKAVSSQRSQFLSNPAVRDAANRVTTGPEYVTSISAMPSSQSSPRVAQVTRYQYAGGITVHSYVDLDSGKVLSVTPYANFPTPFSDEETSRAQELAMQQVSAVFKGVFNQRGQNIQVDVLTLTVSDPASPDYGHRIGKVHYRTPEGREVGISPVHVNLTTGIARGL